MVSAGKSQSLFQIILCDRHWGQGHRGSVVLWRGWIWLLLLEEEECKTNFSRFVVFGPVFRNSVFHDVNG